MAVDHVVVAVANRAGLELSRIGAGSIRLGHREAGADFAVETFLQPLLFLIGGAELGEDFHVAGVGRHAVERARADWAAAHQLAQRCVFVVLEAGAEFFVGQEEVPEAFGLGFFADVFQRLRLGIAALAHRALNIFFDRERHTGP